MPHSIWPAELKFGDPDPRARMIRDLRAVKEVARIEPEAASAAFSRHLERVGFGLIPGELAGQPHALQFPPIRLRQPLKDMGRAGERERRRPFKGYDSSISQRYEVQTHLVLVLAILNCSNPFRRQGLLVRPRHAKGGGVPKEPDSIVVRSGTECSPDWSSRLSAHAAPSTCAHRRRRPRPPTAPHHACPGSIGRTVALPSPGRKGSRKQMSHCHPPIWRQR